MCCVRGAMFAVHSRSPTSNNPIIIIRLSLRFFLVAVRVCVPWFVREKQSVGGEAMRDGRQQTNAVTPEQQVQIDFFSLFLLTTTKCFTFKTRGNVF